MTQSAYTDQRFHTLVNMITQSNVIEAISDLANGRVRPRFHKPVSRFIVGSTVDGVKTLLALREVVSLAVEKQFGKAHFVSVDFGSPRDAWCIKHLATLQIKVHRNRKKYLKRMVTLLPPTPEQEQEQYEADDQLRLAKQRVGHSLFSDRVTQNFEGRCCLTGIAERELLVASHIVPWAEERKFRLDPSNGLLLESRYDRLFENGFLSFTDELVVQVTKVKGLSTTLKNVLAKVDGRKARKPLLWPISPEHLQRHREQKFKK